jgi:hypothetical protein
LPTINSIGQNIINNSRKNNKDHKETTGFIKKIKREKTKDIAPDQVIISEPVIKSDKNGKEENKKTIIEQQRVLWIVLQLFQESMYVK